jgi:hypothetical protein
MIKQAIVKDKNILILLSLYSFLLLFFCSKMSPLYPINEWSDVNLYYNIGKAIFNGRTYMLKHLTIKALSSFLFMA